VKLQDVILIGDRDDQPDATDVAAGTLYSVVDEELVVERSNGTTWETYVQPGVIAAGVPFPTFNPLNVEPPASNPATFDTRNGHPVLDFDGSTDEEAVWTGRLAGAYAGGGLTLDTFWSFTSATSGNLRVQAAFERMNLSGLDIDADSFASFQSAGGSAPGTSGQIIKVTITFTDGAQIDSLAAGDLFRLKIRRDADGTSGTDDITTDAEFNYATISETF
jgi:hypothetical protein